MSKNTKVEKQLLNKNWKRPTVSLFLCIAFLFLIATLNIFAHSLPASIMQKDMTTTGIYTLSSDTKAFLQGIDDSINIFWICPNGKENSRTETILRHYDEQSDNISVSKIDPAYYPNFVQRHSDEASLTYNSLIVESEKRSQIVKYGDYNTSSLFLLEDYLNSAISSVTTDVLPKIYLLEGHGESVLSAELSSQIKLNGYEVISHSLVNSGLSADEAKVLIILNPQTDITEEERDAVLAYLEHGGRMLLITGFSAIAMPNIDYLMDSCGYARAPGYICEGDSGSFYSSPTYIVPTVVENEGVGVVTEGVAYVLMPVTHGIVEKDIYRSSLSHYSLFKTSDYSYAKQDLMSMDTEFAVGDIKGPFDIGVAAVETTAYGESRVVWFSSSSMLDEKVDAVVSGSNSMLFLNTVNYLAGSNIATIHAKATSTGTLTVMPTDKAILSATMLGIVPGLIILSGVIITIRRRRR